MNGKEADAQKKITGRAGEKVVADYIKSRKMKVVEKNYVTPFGEIDIIAEDDDYIVFIEVKTRSGDRYGAPSEAVDKTKRKHIVDSAKYYLKVTNSTEVFTRFDVAEVFSDNGSYAVNYIEDAFYL